MMEPIRGSRAVVSATVIEDDRPPLDLVVLAWIETKTQRTGSEKTRRAYTDGIASFRDQLRQVNLDLDAADGRKLAMVAQRWANAPRPDGRAVAANTFNQRLAILGSFYMYASKRGLLSNGNPIAIVERRPAEAYATARALDFETVAERMREIDRTTLAGKRDYALLALALSTGRRLSELAGLRWRHLTIRMGRSPTILVTWPRAKGDKHLSDELHGSTAAVLLDWLAMAYGASQVAALEVPAEAPLWISLAHNGTAGKPISLKAIAEICEARLGTSKVHALRHTFAHGMEQVGAKVSDIQARLGHSSLQTTGRYLAQLRSAENAHADDLADLFGLTTKPPKKRR